jgi:site-specific recombinase XerD
VVSQVYCYPIKHSFASALLQTGTDIETIRELLGHADLKSTQVYARSVAATHVQALDRLRAEDQRRYTQSAEASGAADANSVAPNRGSESDAA